MNQDTPDLENLFSENEEFNCSSTFLEEMTNQQSEIIQEGKTIELFIQQNSDRYQNNTSFQLLQSLFNLFKSEIASNISFRQGVIALKTAHKIDNQISTELNNLFTQAQKIDPSLKSLESILNTLKSIFSKDPSRQNSIQTQQKEELINQKSNFEEQISKIKREIQVRRKKFNQQIQEAEVQRNSYASEENLLKEKFLEFQQQKNDLQAQYESFQENQPTDLLLSNLSIINSKIENLDLKMRDDEARHHHEAEVLREQISKNRHLVEDLVETRLQLEKQLDSVNKKIEFYTNPLNSSNDCEICPVAARKKLIDKQEQCSKIVNSFEEMKFRNQKMIEEITALRNILEDIHEKNSKNVDNLQNLQEQFSQKQTIVQHFKNLKDKIDQNRDRIQELEETKRHISLHNNRLKMRMEASKENFRKIQIENRALAKNISEMSSKKMDLEKHLSKIHINEQETEEFNQIAEAFITLRKAFEISSSSTPEEITNAIISSLKC